MSLNRLIIGLLAIVFGLFTLNNMAQNEHDQQGLNCQIGEERDRLAGAFATTDETFPAWLIDSQQIPEDESERWYFDGVLYRAWETDYARYTVKFSENAVVNLGDCCSGCL